MARCCYSHHSCGLKYVDVYCCCNAYMIKHAYFDCSSRFVCCICLSSIAVVGLSGVSACPRLQLSVCPVYLLVLKRHAVTRSYCKPPNPGLIAFLHRLQHISLTSPVSHPCVSVNNILLAVLKLCFRLY